MFDSATPGALLAAIRRAAALRVRPAAWAALQERGMAVDFDWVTGSAPRYVEMYQRAVELRRQRRAGQGAPPRHPCENPPTQ